MATSKNPPNIKLGPSDKIDLQEKVDIALAKENAEAAAAKKFIEEVQEIEDQPDFPRWGGGRLTIASPGDVILDPSYIPDVVETRGMVRRRIAQHRVIDGQMHTLTADGERKFRWCNFNSRKINIHKSKGFRFSNYETLFADTGLFEQGEGKTVRNGDLVLMEISIDGWRRLKEKKRRMQAALEGAAEAETFAAGQQLGVPTFRDDFKRNVREFMT